MSDYRAAPDEFAWPGFGGLLGEVGNTAAVIVTSSTKPSTSPCTLHTIHKTCIKVALVIPPEADVVLCTTATQRPQCLLW